MSSNQKSSLRPVKLLIIFLGGASIVLCLLVLCAYSYYFPGSPSYDHEKWGQFGDYIGGTLNPALAFLGLVAILATLHLQARELRLSAIEFSKSAIALQNQYEESLRARFETTFFNLVDHYHLCVKNIQSGANKGRAAIRYLYLERLRASCYLGLQNTSEPDATQHAYLLFFDEQRHDLLPYFGIIFSILQFLEVAERNRVDIELYAKIFAHQLSPHECAILHYEHLHGANSQSFKTLVEKYRLLRCLQPTDLLATPNAQALRPM